MKNVFFFLFLSTSTWAQVGFNNPNPHPKSILDLTAPDKGLLIPRMSQSLREALFPASDPTAEGMLVYQTDNARGLYYYNGSSWFLLNEWVREATNTGTVVSIGDVTVSGTLTATISNTGSLASSTINNTGTITTNQLTATSASSTNLSANNFTVPGFSTNALVPTGVIVMWSGSPFAVPNGWALCNGASGTPDLRGRFIVSYSNFDGDYSSIGNTGGTKRHALSVAELPPHNHSIPGSNVNGFGGFGAVPGVNPGTNEGGGNTNLTGSGSAHENRPPYYTLAFIMKL
jgi:microcystin-dependent protein